MDKNANWHIVGTPERMRETIPDFSQPISSGPWLLIDFGDGRVSVFGRAALLEFMHAFIEACDEIMSKTTMEAPE